MRSNIKYVIRHAAILTAFRAVGKRGLVWARSVGQRVSRRRSAGEVAYQAERSDDNGPLLLVARVIRDLEDDAFFGAIAARNTWGNPTYFLSRSTPSPPINLPDRWASDFNNNIGPECGSNCPAPRQF
jgi:hypothetical protein